MRWRGMATKTTASEEAVKKVKTRRVVGFWPAGSRAIHIASVVRSLSGTLAAVPCDTPRYRFGIYLEVVNIYILVLVYI
jgi:hypothetical protein